MKITIEMHSVKEYLPNDFDTVLTYNKDALFPVCAYLMDGVWYRVLEGPEDEIIKGEHEPLVEIPTNWCKIEPFFIIGEEENKI